MASNKSGTHFPTPVTHSTSPFTFSLPTNTNKGTFEYTQAFGVSSLKSPKPMELSTVLEIHSCTKLMTAVAVLQCVERGQLDLDADVSSIIPEVGSYGVITGFDERKGEAVLVPTERAVTLRLVTCCFP
jgi:CubicO group peptidase (beta-lactamase class C family)